MAHPHTVHHDVLIVGGGNAGVSLAARLRRDGAKDVAIVDPVSVHRYRPLISYVGGGQARMADLEKPQASVIPKGVRWYQQRVTSVDPVSLGSAAVHSVSPGSIGSAEAGVDPGGAGSGE